MVRWTGHGLTIWTRSIQWDRRIAPSAPQSQGQGHEQVGEERLREAGSCCDSLLAPDSAPHQLLSTAASI